MNEILYKIVRKTINLLLYSVLITPFFLKAQLLVGDSLKYLKRQSYLAANPKLSDLDLLVDSMVKSFMQSPQNCGLSIGISKNGNTYFYNYGEIKRDSKKLPDQNTLYEIGSVTKTFCGLLLANAVIEKKIKLDDDIRKYLSGKYPSLMYNKRPIHISDLANHTSGLPRVPLNLMQQPGFDSLNPYQNYKKQQIFDYLKTLKLTREPGTVCDYSNLGMALLGVILEDVYGKSFEELIKEKICDKNGMSNTTIQLNGDQLSRFAEGYTDEGLNTPHWDLGAFVAAGAIRSTSEDMLKYLTYNLEEKDAVAQLVHKITFNNKETVALSWFLKKTKAANTLIWHNGATYGFSSFCGFIKEKNCSVVILSNSGTNVDYIGIALLNYLQL